MVPTELRLWTVFITAHIQNINETTVNNILKLRCCCNVLTRCCCCCDDEDIAISCTCRYYSGSGTHEEVLFDFMETVPRINFTSLNERYKCDFCCTAQKSSATEKDLSREDLSLFREISACLRLCSAADNS